MKITITAKKMQIPQNFTEYAEKRLSTKLDKFFGSEARSKNHNGNTQKSDRHRIDGYL